MIRKVFSAILVLFFLLFSTANAELVTDFIKKDFYNLSQVKMWLAQLPKQFSYMGIKNDNYVFMAEDFDFIMYNKTDTNYTIIYSTAFKDFDSALSFYSLIYLMVKEFKNNNDALLFVPDNLFNLPLIQLKYIINTTPDGIIAEWFPDYYNKYSFAISLRKIEGFYYFMIAKSIVFERF